MTAALERWRRALALLPPDSRQYATITARIRDLAGAPRPRPPSAGGAGKGGRKAGVLGVVGLGLWKLKAVILLMLGKAKLLLLGLGKLQTLLSMLLSFGVYWTMWGWPYAAGLVLSIYVHEMGHVVALRRLGIAATAPMFIPGLGAFVRLKQSPASAVEDATVGLAGPVWGAGAALAAVGLFFATGAPIFAGIARSGAWINLFNLLPLSSLDGARGLRALSKAQRLALGGVMVAAALVVGDFLLWGLAGLTLFRAFTAKDAPEDGDQATLIRFVALVGGLALLVRAPFGAP